MSGTFKCGDRVRLREGDQVMTVTGVSPDSTGIPTVWCAWFNDQNVHNTAGYASAELEAVEIADLGSPC